MCVDQLVQKYIDALPSQYRSDVPIPSSNNVEYWPVQFWLWDKRVIEIDTIDGSFGAWEHILDEGWYQFTNMLEYKMKWYGGSIIKIDRFFPSSKTCSACGCEVSKMPLNIREWVCPDCGCVHDRDINAAQNILTEGLRLLSL